MSNVRFILALAACFLTITTGQAVQIRRTSGSRIPEHILPTDRDNPALWNGSLDKYTKAAAPGAYATSDVPRTGDHEYILILVDFINLPFIINDTAALLKQYDRIFNERGYNDPNTYKHKDIEFQGATGSVSDYFYDQSFGQYNPTFKIVGPVHPSKGFEYYGKDHEAKLNNLVREICDSVMLKGLVDLDGYTRNGSIDQLSFIYAGRGENYEGADVNTIWPQASVIENYNKYGIKNIKYACTCELFWDSDSILDGIGTFCHEFSHTLGLPDFYNTDNNSGTDSKSNAAMGYWSLMDYGTYENQGFSPVGYTAFEKYSIGWMDLEEIQGTGHYYLQDISKVPDPDSGTGSAYVLSTGQPDNFIILENHVKTGWYKYHASEGLMVTAVSYDYNSWGRNRVNYYKSNKRYRILPADNDYERTTNDGDLFPYNDIDSITTNGTPELSVGSSLPAYSIYTIRKEGGLVSFYAELDRTSGMGNSQSTDVTVSLIDGELSITAPAGLKATVHDLSGNTVSETVITRTGQRIGLPGKGIWIVKCGDVVRKIAL